MGKMKGKRYLCPCVLQEYCFAADLLYLLVCGEQPSFPVKLHSFCKCCLQRFPKQTKAARLRGLGDLLLPGCSLELALSVKGLLAGVFLCSARCMVHTEV